MQSVGIAFPWELGFLTNHLLLLVGDYNTQVAKKRQHFITKSQQPNIENVE